MTHSYVFRVNYVKRELRKLVRKYIWIVVDFHIARLAEILHPWGFFQSVLASRRRQTVRRRSFSSSEVIRRPAAHVSQTLSHSRWARGLKLRLERLDGIQYSPGMVTSCVHSAHIASHQFIDKSKASSCFSISYTQLSVTIGATSVDISLLVNDNWVMPPYSGINNSLPS